MQRLLTDDQVEQIWGVAEDRNIYATRTIDQWGNPMVIFENWRDVEKVADIVMSVIFPSLDEDTRLLIPTWEHSRYPVDARHHIEWAIGDFGFSDQYMTCDNCYVAVDTQDYGGSRYWYDGDNGVITCDDCIKTNPEFAEEYLTYCARHLSDHEIAQSYFANPSDHGYASLNAYSVTGGYSHSVDSMAIYLGVDYPVDHPEWRGMLDYADSKDRERLAKAARLIDPNVMIVAQYTPSGYGSLLYWAKFEQDPMDGVEVGTEQSDAMLNYAISRIMAKYGELAAKEMTVISARKVAV